MPDLQAMLALAALGLASYTMRAGGFIAAGALATQGRAARLLKVAAGNVFVAFVAAGCLRHGLSAWVGSAVALLVMAFSRREWLALAAGLLAAFGTSAVRMA